MIAKKCSSRQQNVLQARVLAGSVKTPGSRLWKGLCSVRVSGANTSKIVVLQAAQRTFVSGSAEKLE